MLYGVCAFACVCVCVFHLNRLCVVSVDCRLVLYAFVCVFCVFFHVFVYIVSDLLCGVAWLFWGVFFVFVCACVCVWL